MICLAQLTDTHIREPGRLAYRRINTADYLASAVTALMSLPQKPRAVVLTGDLTDFGRIAEYQHLAKILRPLDVPYYLMPGNHDDRGNLRRAFPSHSYLGTEGFIQFSVEIGELRLIALDSSQPGQSAGRLCESRLSWLEQQLEHDQHVPTVIAIHHPPFKTLIGHMDKIGLLEGAGELENIISRYKNIERVICGHVHRTIYTKFGQTIASIAPSPAHQVCFDLQEEAVSAWNLEPPGFHVHAWKGPGSLLTNLVPIGPFAGPYPFYENGILID